MVSVLQSPYLGFPNPSCPLVVMQEVLTFQKSYTKLLEGGGAVYKQMFILFYREVNWMGLKGRCFHQPISLDVLPREPLLYRTAAMIVEFFFPTEA